MKVDYESGFDAPVRILEVREAFRGLDIVDVETILEQRAAVMKTVPIFLRGPFRNALKVALAEILASPDAVRQERGWKLLILLPRMLLHRPPGGGLIAKEKLEARFHAFGRGDWGQLLEASQKCDEKAAQSRRRGRRRTVVNDVENRVLRAELLVQVGELSAARQALEGTALAPGNQATLDLLTDATRHPPHLRTPLSPEVLGHTPIREFELDEPTFNKNLRSSRRGAAGGPSGMTMEHLRPLLDEPRALHLFFLVAQKLARADVPDTIVDLIRVGRLTSLTKPDGGVRGIVAGDVVRRLVARTISQQLGPEVEQATSPYQYAMSTRAGCECVAQALQGLTELDPNATVTSVDGISAFDMISRQSMLEGLRQLPVGNTALPFVRLFYGRQSRYLWEFEDGEIHHIPQGEGGEQGDAMMPLLFSLGQHRALQAVAEQLQEGEHLFAYLDDTIFVSSPLRVGPVYAALQESLHVHAGIQINAGKTQIWNKAGVRPEVCNVLERVA